MPRFVDTDRLVRAVRLLDLHHNEISIFYGSMLGLQVSGHGIKKLKTTFRASVSERRGASFDRGEEAVTAFDGIVRGLYRAVNRTILQDPARAHRELFESIVLLRQIDQKIAAMFLKFVVVYGGMWSEILSHLYVPVDTVVLKMLRRKLRVYTGPWATGAPTIKSEGRLTNGQNERYASYEEFVRFQNDLRRILRHTGLNRILVDELWLVGNIFCKEYPLCSRCWIRDLCQEREN